MLIDKKTLKKFKYGDSLTDKEVKDLFDFYTNLYESLFCLGTEFNIIRLHICPHIMRLQDMALSRKLLFKEFKWNL